MDDPRAPEKWRDLAQHERDAILGFARLSKTHRDRIYKAGANIAFWDGLIERCRRWKVLWWVVAYVVAEFTGFIDALVAAWQDRK